ncbi:hypothetical protein FACS1894151_05720 [Spirochaetia bacterium]|nr:hypothetical protein FACS1894151_05720 [Spirochaetia bacterium]
MKGNTLSNTATNVPPSLSAMMGKLCRRFISPEDQVLINTVFADSPSQEKLDECLRVCDIEVMGAYKTLA